MMITGRYKVYLAALDCVFKVPFRPNLLVSIEYRSFIDSPRSCYDPRIGK